MRIYKTIKDIKELRNEMYTGCDPEIVAHARSLMGPRTRGSTTEKGLSAIPDETELIEIFPPAATAQPGSRYFTVPAPNIGGRLGAVSLFKAEELGLKVEERMGKHGPELFINRPVEEAEMLPCTFITVITGEHDGQEILFTWHPGGVLGTLAHGRTPQTAVKLHNG